MPTTTNSCRISPGTRRGPPRTGHRGLIAQLRNTALRHAARGNYVFPLWPTSKVPAMHGQDTCPATGDCGDGHQGWEARATRDPDLIRFMWTAEPFNIAIATGRSGLHVLDLDTAHGQTPPARWAGARHGRDVLACLAEAAGQPFPDSTFIVRTGTGGWHLYFQAPTDPVLRNTTGRAGWRVDSRGAGGYIIAAGSMSRHGPYRVLNNAPVAPMPPFLIPLLTPPVLPQFPVPDLSRPHEPPAQARTQRYLDAVADRVCAADVGNRHRTLLKAAITLGRLVTGREISDHDARSALFAATTELAKTGFPAREAERVIRDGLRYGYARPRLLVQR